MAQQIERPTTAAQRKRPTPRLICEIRPQDRVEVTGTIITVAALSISGCPACRYTLADGTGQVDLMFLGRIAIRGLDCGTRCTVVGTVATRDDRIVIWNPFYEVHAADTLDDPEDPVGRSDCDVRESWHRAGDSLQPAR
jgi:hypothetical protein